MVCLPCQADVVYGLRKCDRDNLAKIGFYVGTMVGVGLMVLLPGFIQQHFGIAVPPGWGLGFNAVFPIAAVAAVGAACNVHFAERAARAKPPTFLRRTMDF